MEGKTYLIDTNYLLRLLIADIPEQSEKSRRLFHQIEEEKAIGLISLLVINELIWILEHFYQQKRKQFIPQLLKLLALKKIRILEVKKDQLMAVLKLMLERKLDFTDYYLAEIAKREGFALVSFDKKLNRLLK